MSDFDHIPPELTGIDEHMTANRPVADGHTLDRVMTRAQRARSERGFRPHGPGAHRSKKRIVAVTAATLFTMAGTTGLAAAVMGVSAKDAVSTFSTSSPDSTSAATKQYCPGTTNQLPPCKKPKP